MHSVWEDVLKCNIQIIVFFKTLTTKLIFGKIMYEKEQKRLQQFVDV